MEKTVTIGGVKLTHFGVDSVREAVIETVAQKQCSRPLRVFTPNVEQLIQTVEQPAFLAIINQAEVTVPDSVGLVKADWWKAFTTGSSWKVRERVAGVDLAEALLSEAAKRGWKVVLVGGTDKVSELACRRLKNQFKGLWVDGVNIGKVSNDGQIVFEEKKVLKKIQLMKPDLVLVGLGAPKQEKWTLKYGQELAAKVIMVVGGAIEMWAGVQKRAPKWMRQIGLEWLWRLIQQPWRIGRQLRLIRFVWLVVRGKIVVSH